MNVLTKWSKNGYDINLKYVFFLSVQNRTTSFQFYTPTENLD